MSRRRRGADDTEVVRAEEQLGVRREERPSGTARLRTEVIERDVAELVELMADDVEVLEVPVADGDADSGEVETTADGDMSVPVLAERLVLRKEAYVTKRIVLRRTRRRTREEVHETLRAQRVTVEVDAPPGPPADRGQRAVIEPDPPAVVVEAPEHPHERSNT
jgi:uncharacterized protein (TIGR02271 family)